MIINYNNKDITIPKPFDQCFFGSNPLKEMTIHNRFNDEAYQQYAKLPAFAIAVYDVIMGSEMFQDWKSHRQGLDWFIKYFPREYMVLLD